MSSAGLLSYLLMTAGVISLHSMTATGSCFVKGWMAVDGGTCWRSDDGTLARLKLLWFISLPELWLWKIAYDFVMSCDCFTMCCDCFMAVVSRSVRSIPPSEPQSKKMSGVFRQPWGQLAGDGGRLLTQRRCEELRRHRSGISWHLCCPHATRINSPNRFQGSCYVWSFDVGVHPGEVGCSRWFQHLWRMWWTNYAHLPNCIRNILHLLPIVSICLVLPSLGINNHARIKEMVPPLLLFSFLSISHSDRVLQ